VKIIYKTDLDNPTDIELQQADIVIEKNPLDRRNETVVITKNRFGPNGHVVDKLYFGAFLLNYMEKWHEQVSNAR